MVCLVCDGECMVTCPACHGTRLLMITPQMWETCLRCDMKGQVTCPECEGTGVIGDDFR
jgi:DnaJ-class molecular chaperone